MCEWDILYMLVPKEKKRIYSALKWSRGESRTLEDSTVKCPGLSCIWPYEIIWHHPNNVSLWLFFNRTVLLSSLSFWRLNLRCVVFSRATLLWRCMHFLLYKYVHWQPVRLMMKLFDLENELETLALGCDCDCKSHPVDPIPQFQLEPLPWFCIDHPNIGDCIVYKVSAEVHPRGIQMILCTPAPVNASFKHYTLCVR